MSRTINLGRVSFLPKGEWNPEVYYDFLDVVSYGGNGFIVRKRCIGITPAEGDYYMQFTDISQANGGHADTADTANNATTADEAEKLINAHLFGVSGALTAEQYQFDGTQDVIINVTGVDGNAVNGAVRQATELATPRSVAITGVLNAEPVIFNGTDDITLELTGELGTGSNPDAHAVVLKAANWKENVQTVAAIGIDEDETTQLISWMPKASDMDICDGAGIKCISQAQDSLTFRAKNVPSNDITLYITIQPLNYT